ncbi:zinc finger protein JAGGED [Rosa chinensis]|nr:zinc finger protein JAGGED [Rosa chinensis]XP_040375006.1 zinc finger protein JAGGED [Rosa chinensis]XP_040375007.1 zinc finger protein JAGGED [Rosa chinensis]
MNPLDLNNLPDDHNRDRDRDRDRENGKQFIDGDASSSSGHRKKKSGGKDGKDESGKVYECRFCSLKFCKSQALGGHMNRHRQERETETLNRARQLVFNNDNLAAPGPPHLGCCHPMTSPGGYPHPIAGAPGDPTTLPLRFPARMFSGSPSTQLIPPPPAAAPGQPPQAVQPSQPYLYPSPSRPMSYPSSHYQHQNDYYVGHVLGGNNTSASQYGHHLNVSYGATAGVQDHHQSNNNGYNNYTCIGAPVSHSGGFGQGSSSLSSELTGSGGGGGVGGGARDGSMSYSGTQPPPPPSINRFQHGF